MPDRVNWLQYCINLAVMEHFLREHEEDELWLYAKNLPKLVLMPPANVGKDTILSNDNIRIAFAKYLAGGRECPIQNFVYRGQYEACLAAAAAEAAKTVKLAIAGIMLLATGAFAFAPILAGNIISRLAE